MNRSRRIFRLISSATQLSHEGDARTCVRRHIRKQLSLIQGEIMKLTVGQIISLVIAMIAAALLTFEVPFEAAASGASAAQVVYAPLFTPPDIGGAAGKIDLPLLLLELLFVAFIGGAIFLASGRKED
jgi:hypothetical protein